MSKLISDTNARILRVMFIVCMLIIALLSTGCDAFSARDKAFDIYYTTENASVNELKPYTTFNNPVTEPHAIKYLVPNALIEVNTEKLPKSEPPIDRVGTTQSVSYPYFSGLKSQEVQDKVNAQIESLMFEMDGLLIPETIAPFRGIKTVVNEDSTRSDSYLSIYTSFSYNNILSLRAYSNGTYKSTDASTQDMTWLSLSRGLNLDLNTGERVPLKALFVDGYDYESVINDAIVEQIQQNNLMDEAYLEYSYFPARLTKPFDGIAHDQAYCLDPFNLTIIIDENDPRFDTTFEQITFNIPLAKFEDNLAIDARYFKVESSLFIDETAKRMLPVWNLHGKGQSENFEGSFEGGKWYMMAFDQVDRLDDVYDALVLESKNYLSGLKMEGMDNYAQISLSKVAIGDFVTISKYVWVSDGKNYFGEADYQVYDATNHRLTLDDLFVEDFDYESIIKNQVRSQILLNGSYTDDEIESAYATKCFSLDQSNLTIHVSLPDRGMGTQQQIYIPFDVFGVLNMTIFD